MTAIFPLLAALAILPSQTRDDTRSVILKRDRGGPARLAIVVPGKANPEHLDGRTRIAVAPITVRSADKALAGQGLGLMNAIAADLRYVPAYLVADRSEVLAAIEAGGGGPIPATLRETLGAKLVVSGTLSEEGAELELELHLDRVEKGRSNRVGSGKSVGTRDRIFALGDEALLALLDAAGVTPPALNVDELRRVPTRSFVARSEVDAGLAQLDGLTGPGRTDETVETRSELALKHADAALKDDPDYPAAFILRATCLHNLGLMNELTACLQQAREKYEADDARFDRLTAYELLGDELAFNNKRQLKEAAGHYESILFFDKGNLGALWSLIGCYAGDHGETNLAASPEKAGEYAARLILAHPKSAAARALSPKPFTPSAP